MADDVTDFSPTLRLQRLAAELRRARLAAELTTDAVEKRLEWGKGKISRLENRQTRRPRVTDVRLLLDLYGVDDDDYRETLYGLARDARQRGWWTRFGDDVFKGLYVDYETEAVEISTFEPVFVPGLLQTEEYAEAITRAGLIRDEEQIARRVAARIQRRQIFNRADPPEYWAVIDELALRRSIGGPEVMKRQLQHIVDAASTQAINVQVVRDGAHAGLAGPFVIMGFRTASMPSIVYLETATDGLYLEQPDEVRFYERIFNSLRSSAPAPQESVAFIQDMINEL